MNIEKGMYTPERSPSLIKGARGQNSASIILQDEEHTNANTLNPENDGPAKYDSPTPEELSATQKLDEGKVMCSLNQLARHNLWSNLRFNILNKHYVSFTASRNREEAIRQIKLSN